ncbi:MAG TPA: response regulator, partial [Geobacteraceae bacterium]|nr:response regulator [Geobacteraceae bacterium]
MKYKLLILDDEQEILEMLSACFQEDVQLFLENEGEAALRRIASERPNVAIIDINLPGKSGLEVLKEAKKIDPGLAVIMATGQGTTKTAIESMKLGAYDYLPKPFDVRKMQT